MDDPDQSKVEDAEGIGGTWKEAIRAAFEATKSAFPGGEILAHLDHKLVFIPRLSLIMAHHIQISAASEVLQLLLPILT